MNDQIKERPPLQGKVILEPALTVASDERPPAPAQRLEEASFDRLDELDEFTEVESALVSHEAVAESAVVGRPDEIKGQAVVAFVTVKEGHTATEALAKELKSHVGKVIGAIAKPDDIRFTAALPKTRSGKIMRRLLKEIVAGGAVKGDTTTLEDLTVLAQLAQSTGKDD